MEIYKSKYLQVNYTEVSQLIEVMWLPETTNMTNDEYKTEFLNYFDLFSKNKITKVLVNEQNLSFPVAPDLQEWVNKTIFSKMPPQNLAIVVPKNLIGQLAVEQLLDEEEGKKIFLTKFFDNQEDANKWILSL